MKEANKNSTKVKIGHGEYNHIKTEDGNEYLEKNNTLEDKNIKIIIKGSNYREYKDVEKVITDVLSNQYIQRNIKGIN